MISALKIQRDINMLPVEAAALVGQVDAQVVPLSDKEFREEFVKRPYVFNQQLDVPYSPIAGICSQNRVWCAENFQDGFHFYSGFDHICSLCQWDGVWKIQFASGFSNECRLLSDAIDHIFERISAVQELQFLTYAPEPGVIWSKPFGFETKFLESMAPGTFFVEAKCGTYANVCVKGRIQNFALCPQMKTNELTRDPEAIKQWVVRSAGDRDIELYQRLYGVDVTEELTLCTSLMDLTPLLSLDSERCERVISGFTASQFEHTEYVLLCANRDHEVDSLVCYKNLLLFFAKNNKLSVRFGYSKYIWSHFSPNCEMSKVNDHLAEFRRTLQGEQLEWALDRYYEAIFYNTSGKFGEFKIPLVEPRKQQFYNNPDLGTDLVVQLKDPKDVIHVHRAFLGVFSEKLKTMIFHGFGDSKKSTISFPEYSDEVVTQLMRLIYGFEPEFDGCNLAELLQLSGDILSEQLTSLVNKYINNMFEQKKVTPDVLAEVMVNPHCWTHLPQLGPFFRYVSDNWDELIASCEVEDQKFFRDTFFAIWQDFVAPNKDAKTPRYDLDTMLSAITPQNQHHLALEDKQIGNEKS